MTTYIPPVLLAIMLLFSAYCLLCIAKNVMIAIKRKNEIAYLKTQLAAAQLWGDSEESADTP